ncbi:MAG: DEAD/DEAH box helicase, partial [Draconibacterium sp.]|nr:DEAD/DEAH box helicase [Draconibacterium sp.]
MYALLGRDNRRNFYKRSSRTYFQKFLYRKINIVAMKLKKLIPELSSAIIEAGFDITPRSIQSKSIPKIKSGADMFIISPEGTGKSVTIVISVIQQLKEAIDEAPRAIVMVTSKEKAFELKELFDLLGKNTNLRSFV